MKLIPVVNLLLPLLASPLLSAAVASDEQQPFSYVEVSSLLAEGDDCERLAAYLGDHVLEHSLEVDDRLEAAIRLNRPGSFRCLYAHIHFPDPLGYIHTRQLSYYLGLALLHHQPEICDFLLAIDFAIKGNETDFWVQVPFAWTFEELVDLTKRHPRFVSFMVPRWRSMACAPNFEAASRMLDFVKQVYGLYGGFSNKGFSQPNALMEGLAENKKLTNAEMAALFERLFQLGAEVDSEDFVELFAENNPGHVMAYQVLLGGSQDPDIKEPADS